MNCAGKVSGTFYWHLLLIRLLFLVMGRPKRAAKAGIIYHVLNRANAKMTIFKKDADYRAFENVLTQAVQRSKMQLLSYC